MCWRRPNEPDRCDGAREKENNNPNPSIWLHHIPERFSLVPGPTRHWKNALALVRRLRSSVEYMPALFSSAPTARLSLRTLDQQVSRPEKPSAAPHSPACIKHRGIADYTERRLEANGWRRPNLTDHRAHGGDNRAPVFFTFHHQPTAPGMVRTGKIGDGTLPAFCPVQFRVDAWTFKLSGRL